MSFHYKRYRAPTPSLLQRAWEFHDDHPFPPALNRAARKLVYIQRPVAHALAGPTRYSVDGEVGGPQPVPRDRFLAARSSSPLPLHDAAAWFGRVHEANEAVYRGNGSWSPHPFSGYYGQGLTIEEIAHRIPGHLSAYRATNEPQYLQRALAAGDYLLRERLFADGNVHCHALPASKTKRMDAHRQRPSQTPPTTLPRRLA